VRNKRRKQAWRRLPRAKTGLGDAIAMARDALAMAGDAVPMARDAVRATGDAIR